MFTLAFYEQGHFHAAVTLKGNNPRINERVHLYAKPSREHDAFVALVQSFNQRNEASTNWNIQVHESANPLAALIDDKLCHALILTGRNDSKLQTIAT